MSKRFLAILILFILVVLILTACNMPGRQFMITPTPAGNQGLQSTPTPTPLCANPYFPNTNGDKWEYSGANTVLGAYTQTDTIINSGSVSFTQQVTQTGTSYTVPYDCSPSGLASTNPIQQYAGALLNNPQIPVTVTLTSTSGISLPTKITPGDTWQQTADWDASSKQINMNGRFVFEYTAVGYEEISVPAGNYNALRVDATVRVELTGFHILAGTYTTTSWWVPEVGMVKSEGTSHVSGFNFTDSMELTRFAPGP